MLKVGNVEISDLACVTPPWFPEGAHAMTQLIELPPADESAPPPRHSGPVFCYMLEGRMLFELEGEAPREIKAGEAFWEPAGTWSTGRLRIWSLRCGASSSRCASARRAWT
jgi:quercetin dioxygenase-like cupin family protein